MPLTLNEEFTYLPGGFFTCRTEEPNELISLNRELLTLTRAQTVEQFAQLTGGTFSGLVHPDDRERIELSLKAQRAQQSLAHTDFAFRLKTLDAAIRYVSCYLKQDDELGVLYGFVADITVQREGHLDVLRRKDLYHDLYRKAHLSEERFRFISSFAGVMLYEYDLSNRESSRFENAPDVLGYTEWELQQIFCESKTTDCLQYLMTEEDYAATADFYSCFNENGEAEGELRIRRKDGSYHWFYDKRCLVLSPSGDGSFIRGCLWNADSTHRRISGLVESSERDGVTGLYNRSSGFAAIQDKMQSGAPQSAVFVLFDIDQLKLVNDTLGYREGDALLRQIALELVRVFGKDGVVGRFGADEFFVFLPSVVDADAVVEKIKRFCTILKGAKQSSALGNPISLCAGVVSLTNEEKVSELFEKAERALASAKLLGRGSCCVYTDTVPLVAEDPEVMGLREKKEFVCTIEKRLRDEGLDGVFSVVAVGIENFELLNSWFGPRLADQYIAEISYALSELEGKSGCPVSYFGKDRFGILLSEGQVCLGDLEERLVGIGKSLLGTVACLPAIGVCRLRLTEGSVGDALSRAAEAEKSIYGNYRSRVAYYKETPPSPELSQKQLMTALRDSIKKQEIVPCLRPAVMLATNEIVGADAVSRWMSPDAKTLDEENYIHEIEALGLTAVLRRALWEKLLAQLRPLCGSLGKKLPPVTLSISYADLCSMDVRSTLDGLTEKYGLSPACFYLELSEKDYLGDEDFSDAEIARLRAGGYRVLLGDVHLCYAMLRRLKDLHVDGIRIPSQQLTVSGVREGEALRIAERLIPLAEELSLQLVFTGVEDKALGERLMALGAHTVTGSAYYPSMTVSALGSALQG